VDVGNRGDGYSVHAGSPLWDRDGDCLRSRMQSNPMADAQGGDSTARERIPQIREESLGKFWQPGGKEMEDESGHPDEIDDDDDKRCVKEETQIERARNNQKTRQRAAEIRFTNPPERKCDGQANENADDNRRRRVGSAQRLSAAFDAIIVDSSIGRQRYGDKKEE